jgi:LysM repeat protein
MKKLLLLFLSCLILPAADLYAQTANYTVHVISKGETLTMLAKKYNTTVSNIMRANGMNAKSKLTIGEKVKIPSANTPAEETVAQKTVAHKTSAKSINDTSVITHYVLQGETLFGIGKKFGVTVEQLKQWNNLADDNIHFGQLLAVSDAGKNLVSSRYSEQQSIEASKAEVPKTEAPTVEAATNNAAIPKNESSPDITTQQSTFLIVKKNTQNAIPLNSTNATSANKSAGYFAKEFPNGSSVKNLSGDAMTFKTVTGWKDKKYYILTNEIPAGKIVKVSSLSGKSVYAKVLWTLDNTKMNEGLSFRISDAAASTLGVKESKFNLMVEYDE